MINHQVKSSYAIAIISILFFCALFVVNFARKEIAKINFVAYIPEARTLLAQAGGSLSDGLVGHWTFDEGSGTTAGDSSGAGNNGTLVNFPSDGSGWVDGYFGKALKFNGTNTYVNLPKILANKTQFTISMRARFDGATDFQGALMGHSNGGFYIRKAGSCNSIITWVVNSLSTNVGASLNGSPSSGIACDSWQMHTFTMQTNGTFSYYIDGEFIKSATHPSWDSFNASHDNRIGQYAGSGYVWNGLIDDTRIYDRALSAVEISELYNQGTPNEVVEVSTADREAPSIPANLVATSVSATQNNLSWDASTDNVGVTGYKVYRGTTDIGNTTNPTFQDTNVPSDNSSVYTTSIYTVLAYDAQNNRSNKSASASATFQSANTENPANVAQNLNGLTLGTNLRIDNLGAPLKGNTQEHQVMYKTNDGHRHLQMYYDTFGASPIDVVDIDLENAKVVKSSLERNVGRVGTRCHVFYPANNKMYIGSSDPGSFSEFDPTTGATKYISAVKYKGAYHCEIGDDGWIYIGQITAGVVKGAGLERYNPTTGVWQDLGVIDPAFNGALQYAYTLGADNRYVYISLGQLPWYLAVYDTQATSNKIKIYFKENGDTNSNISKGADGKWYYTKYHLGETPYKRMYKFENGIPVEVSSTPVLDQWYQQSNVISDKSAFKQVFNTEVNFDKANSNSENGGTVEISWKTDSGSWQSATVNGLSQVARTIKRLYPWPGREDKFLGWASEYGLVFLYDASSKDIQSLGYPTRSLYDAVFVGPIIYISGYTAITMKYDPSKPWTLSASTLDPKSTSVNPYIFYGQYGKYHYYSTLGSDGMLYIATHHERGSVGGEIAWYNLSSGASASLREPFLDYDVSDLKSALNGTKIVYSSSKDKLFIFDVATKRIEREITPIPGNMEIDKIFETEPGIIFGIYDTKYFKANIQTGEIIYIKDLGGRAFPGIPAYDRRLVKGPDGYAWLFIDDKLSRINPVDGTIQKIMTAPVSSFIFNGNDLYFYGGTTISRIRNILIGEITNTPSISLPVTNPDLLNTEDSLPVNASCSTRLNRCSTGSVSGRTSNTTHNLWTCNGLNGGTNASCSILKTAQDPVNPIVPVDPLPLQAPLTPTYTPAYTPTHTPTTYVYKKPATPAPKVISPTPDLPPSPSFEPLDFIPTDYIQILLDLIKQFFIDLVERIKRGVDRIIG